VVFKAISIQHQLTAQTVRTDVRTGSDVGVASFGIALMIGDGHCGVRYEINLICAQNLADHLCYVKRR